MKYFIAATLLMLLACSAVVLFDDLSNKIIIVNESNQTISTLTVTINDRQYRFIEVKPDTTVSSRFTADTDGSYVVEGQLEDGTLFEGENGYVTGSMMSVRTRIVIGPQGVVDIEELFD